MRRHSPLRQPLAGSCGEGKHPSANPAEAIRNAPGAVFSARYFSRQPASVLAVYRTSWLAGPRSSVFLRRIPSLLTVGRCDALPQPRTRPAGVAGDTASRTFRAFARCGGADFRDSARRKRPGAGGTSEPIGRFPPDREPPAGVRVRRLGRFEHAPPAMFLALRPVSGRRVRRPNNTGAFPGSPCTRCSMARSRVSKDSVSMILR